MKTYTDADVTRLVTAAKRMVKEYPSNYHVKHLADALAPFQPDPEAALIEQMCEAYLNVEPVPPGSAAFQRMTAALAVAREHKGALA